jgi:hypothetical protein
MADREGDKVIDPIRCQRGEAPRQCRAPIVTHDMGPFDGGAIEHGQHVVGEGGQCVGLCGLRCVRRTEAP